LKADLDEVQGRGHRGTVGSPKNDTKVACFPGHTRAQLV
jgi:hypothetical protein